MSKDNFETAFPFADERFSFFGMTVRDYFAAKAMQPIYENYTAYAEEAGYDENWITAIALDSYAMADAMLEARK